MHGEVLPRDVLAAGFAVDDHRLAAGELREATAELRRSYVTRITLHRLHQTTFRERVLRAYREQCAVCRLRHAELLEAAHIRDILEEVDGPMLRHGLQEMQGSRLHAPRPADLRPRAELLAERYERFRKAG